MCGIVGAITERNCVPLLLEGLKHLEYRGYDSAGLAVLDERHNLQRIRAVGKVASLVEKVQAQKVQGKPGIAHTRWATHGIPSEQNAHPHISKSAVVVHNGIIENHAALKTRLEAQGYVFDSGTDTEVIVHLIDSCLQNGNGDLLSAVQEAVHEFKGAYALGVISPLQPNHLICARYGSPLVIGVGIEENFIASDIHALLPLTQRFIYLKEGDIAQLSLHDIHIYDSTGKQVERPTIQAETSSSSRDKGEYRHYMQKEIFEQPAAIAETLEGRVYQGRLLEDSFGHQAGSVFKRTRAVHITACGTSYHAGLVASYWLEALGIPCRVELGSEYRYRAIIVPEDTLLVTISQSGETADTLAALRKAQSDGAYLASLSICNVPESSLVRESDLVMMTRAGPEIGVASTKAFTTQLVALRLLSIALGRNGGLSAEQESAMLHQLESLPLQIEQILEMDDAIAKLAEKFTDKHNSLFLGRGVYYPIAMEGALKLKEISYIHAEAYAAGELKHGPLALVDSDMPVVCVLPDNQLLDKVLSNLQEVCARGGELFLFAENYTAVTGFNDEQAHILPMVAADTAVAPIVYTVPLQLLAYHVAVLKGTDIDQPRNLAKSVTVE